MQVDAIQIGFQKCGTTFLQKKVYGKHPDIQCIQISDDEKLSRFMINHFIIPDRLEFNPHHFKSMFNYLFNYDLTKWNDNKKVVMFEPFTFMYQRRFDRKNVIERIKTFFPDAKIIMFIREQESWVLSHYSQYIKSGGILKYRDFVELLFNNKNLDSHYIDWYPLIKCLKETFGDKLKVFLYEELQENPQDIANQIYNFLDVKQVQVDTGKVNPSLSKRVLNFKRILNHCFRHETGISNYGYMGDIGVARPTYMQKKLHNFTRHYYKPFTLNFCNSLNKRFKGKKLESNKDQQHYFVNNYYFNNVELAELLNKDLEKYGYSFAQRRCSKCCGEMERSPHTVFKYRYYICNDCKKWEFNTKEETPLLRSGYKKLN